MSVGRRSEIFLGVGLGGIGGRGDLGEGIGGESWFGRGLGVGLWAEEGDSEFFGGYEFGEGRNLWGWSGLGKGSRGAQWRGSRSGA